MPKPTRFAGYRCFCLSTLSTGNWNMVAAVSVWMSPSLINVALILAQWERALVTRISIWLSSASTMDQQLGQLGVVWAWEEQGVPAKPQRNRTASSPSTGTAMRLNGSADDHRPLTPRVPLRVVWIRLSLSFLACSAMGAA